LLTSIDYTHRDRQTLPSTLSAAALRLVADKIVSNSWTVALIS